VASPLSNRMHSSSNLRATEETFRFFPGCPEEVPRKVTVTRSFPCSCVSLIDGISPSSSQGHDLESADSFLASSTLESVPLLLLLLARLDAFLRERKRLWFVVFDNLCGTSPESLIKADEEEEEEKKHRIEREDVDELVKRALLNTLSDISISYSRFSSPSLSLSVWVCCFCSVVSFDLCRMVVVADRVPRKRLVSLIDRLSSPP